MWKSIMEKLLFPDNQADADIESGMTIKHENIPNSLYKYKKFDDKGYYLDLLKNDRIKLSLPGEFNDPFDCVLTLQAQRISNEIMRQRISNINNRLPQDKRLTDDEIEEIKNSTQVIYEFSKLHSEKFPRENGSTPEDYARTISNALDEELEGHYLAISDFFRTGIFITCFSEICDSILMWSHYGHNHEGLCIEYNFKELDYRHPLNRFIFPVIYTDRIYDMTNNLKLGSDGNIFMNTFAAINKSKIWHYEREWRYVFQNGPTEEMQFVSTPRPKSVYLGAKVLQENKKKILEIANRRDFKVYQMSINKSEYMLESRRIH